MFPVSVSCFLLFSFHLCAKFWLAALFVHVPENLGWRNGLILPQFWLPSKGTQRWLCSSSVIAAVERRSRSEPCRGEDGREQASGRNWCRCSRTWLWVHSSSSSPPTLPLCSCQSSGCGRAAVRLFRTGQNKATRSDCCCKLHIMQHSGGGHVWFVFQIKNNCQNSRLSG